MTFGHVAGMALALGLIIFVSFYSGRQIHSAADFSTGGKNGPALVAGAIMGTLVGGTSTVGTAQLAYTCGLSAWWFTLGAGLGCLTLALFYVRPLRASGHTTPMGIIGREFGPGADLLTSLISCLGMLINIIAQLISGVAVVAIICPKLPLWPALLFVALLMICYVVFGGVLSAGAVGLLKLALIYLAVASGAILALALSNGFAALNSQLDPASTWNLFYRGVGKDAGAGLSLILGVVTTQSYAQAVFSARSDRAARCGAMIAACLIPPIGFGSILIGLFMRVNYPGIQSKLAFPQFVIDYMPDLLAGVVLATLLIAVLGTGSGLALGISTILNKEVLPRIPLRWVRRALRGERRKLLANRGCIVAVLLLACSMSGGILGDTVLNFSVMSMGLRAAVMFAPLACALWLRGRVHKSWIMTAIIAGPTMVLLGVIWPVLPLDPLFTGVGVSLLLASIGLLLGRRW